MNLLFSRTSLILLIPGIALTLGCIVTTDELAEVSGSGAATSSGGVSGSGAASATGGVAATATGGAATATGGVDAMGTGGAATATGGVDAMGTGGVDAMGTGGGDAMMTSQTACDDSAVTFACVDSTGTGADLTLPCGAGMRAASCPTLSLVGTCTVGGATTEEVVSYYYTNNAFTEADCTTAMGTWAAAPAP